MDRFLDGAPSRISSALLLAFDDDVADTAAVVTLVSNIEGRGDNDLRSSFWFCFLWLANQNPNLD